MPAKKKTYNQIQNAVIYARYSSHSQREASIEQQVKQATEYAKSKSLMITHIYADKAITGRTDKRTEFQRMMKDAAKGGFQYVIAWKSNRMGRNMLEAMLNNAKLQEMGVHCLYVEEDFDDSASGRFALRNMMNVNQFYSENMAEDIMRGMMDNANGCMVNGGVMPFGYRRGADGKYEVVEEEATIVREIFNKVNKGEPFVDIAAELNLRGIKTKKGAKWNKNSFAKILTNEKYIGVYMWGGVRVENGMPKIIEQELFDMVQHKLKNKPNAAGRHREAGDYLLTGKVFCGKCGDAMTGMSGTSRSGDKHFYYACRTRRTEGSCDKKPAQRNWLEREVAAQVKEYVLIPDTITWMVDCYMKYQKDAFENQEIVSLQNRIKDIDNSLKNIMIAIEKGIINETTQARMAELERERKTVQYELNDLTCNIKQFDRAHVQAYFESFQNGDLNDRAYQKRLLDEFVDAVYLYDDEMRICFSGTGEQKKIPFALIEDIENIACDSVRLTSPIVHHNKNRPNGLFFVMHYCGFEGRGPPNRRVKRRPVNGFSAPRSGAGTAPVPGDESAMLHHENRLIF